MWCKTGLIVDRCLDWTNIESLSNLTFILHIVQMNKTNTERALRSHFTRVQYAIGCHPHHFFFSWLFPCRQIITIDSLMIFIMSNQAMECSLPAAGLFAMRHEHCMKRHIVESRRRKTLPSTEANAQKSGGGGSEKSSAIYCHRLRFAYVMEFY